MRFEAHISAQTQAKGGTKPTQQQHQSKRGFGGTHGATKVNSTDDRHQHKVTNKAKPRPTGDRPPKKCFKCGDQTHGVFQCPAIASPSEAKELYEARTGKKTLKPVLAVTASDSKVATSTLAIPCVVMDNVETEITPDSAAEVSMVTAKSLKLLTAKGVWLNKQDIDGGAAIT
ncbi:hypothetical protein PHYSODRAFT_414934, partial [Phytophthora sojae]